jgi:Fe2+ or Zn2+ uptake regulation protein
MNPLTVQPDEWLAALYQHGYRLTPAKKTLLRLLAEAAFPMSAEKAWELVRQVRPTTGRATVYRLFEALESVGFLRRVHGMGHCNLYVLAQDSTRPMFMCVLCGKAEFLPADVIAAQVEAFSQQRGYCVQTTSIQLLGTCKGCKAVG